MWLYCVCVCVCGDTLIGLYVKWCSQSHILNAVRYARRLQHAPKATIYLINFHILKQSIKGNYWGFPIRTDDKLNTTQWLLRLTLTVFEQDILDLQVLQGQQ